MRYSLGFVCALVLMALALNASAQAGEQGATTEPSLEEPAPSSELEREEPALKLELDEAGVEVAPRPAWTAYGYTVEEIEMNRRVKLARIGLYVSAFALVAGGMTILVANARCVIGEWTESCNRIENAGIFIMSASGAGMIASGVLLGVRKRKLRRLQEAHYTAPRRVQWDVAQSRLVF